MHSATPRAARVGRLVPSFILCAALLGACSDAQPVGVREHALQLPSSTLQALDCVASRSGMSCAPATPATGGASAAIVGGQNTFVRLTSSNVTYDPVAELFQVDVTVQNLMNEAIGTPDGVTPDPNGIMVFFAAEPATSGGSGEVTVDSVDGRTFIMSANQAYHTYPVILVKDQVSPVKTWRFKMPPTVERFRFTVMIQTDVQYLLVINELLANPGGTITDASGEWFEVYNAGSRPVEMQGLVIADSAASGRRPFHLINSSLEVPPGGYVVLGNSTNTVDNGGVPVDYAYANALTFANSLDALKISRVMGTDTLTLDRVQFASAAISAQNGVSRELKNPALDNVNMDGSNWADVLVTAVYGPGGRGTPKAQNSTFTP